MPEEFVDLGCGNDTRDGHLGLDVHLYDAVDIQGDARSLPLADASVKRVRSSQLLEHLNGNEELPALFEEVYRVLEPGGQFVFDVPFGRTWDADPTHKQKWTFKTIVYFLPREEVERLGWSSELFPDYYANYEIGFELVERSAAAWLSVERLPLRILSYAVRQASDYITTDKWGEFPLVAGTLEFRLRKPHASSA